MQNTSKMAQTNNSETEEATPKKMEKSEPDDRVLRGSNEFKQKWLSLDHNEYIEVISSKKIWGKPLQNVV